jgi:ketosteroid isomerase-like protein
MDGQQQNISAPTSILFRRDNDDWKIALIHTVPIHEER